jgi:hypothetical protein
VAERLGNAYGPGAASSVEQFISTELALHQITITSIVNAIIAAAVMVAKPSVGLESSIQLLADLGRMATAVGGYLAARELAKAKEWAGSMGAELATLDRALRDLKSELQAIRDREDAGVQPEKTSQQQQSAINAAISEAAEKLADFTRAVVNLGALYANSSQNPAASQASIAPTLELLQRSRRVVDQLIPIVLRRLPAHANAGQVVGAIRRIQGSLGKTNSSLVQASDVARRAQIQKIAKPGLDLKIPGSSIGPRR